MHNVLRPTGMLNFRLLYFTGSEIMGFDVDKYNMVSIALKILHQQKIGKVSGRHIHAAGIGWVGTCLESSELDIRRML